MGLCFFFKQKTADEMRISDWSSDVCSSDLACGAGAGACAARGGTAVHGRHRQSAARGGACGKGRIRPHRLSRDDGRPGQDAAPQGAWRAAGGARQCGTERKSVGSGKRVSVRVNLGGRRSFKKKKKKPK